ncbi:double-strand break repair helicase AddA [Gluconacetobacter liquefaciens]|uniref:DNA 3'-5' helicase n=1 Tax=Gluconacetobacter liquefaciens TaxID=89584 RepID=A0A370FZG8_GLULI|nr:double-strand break repair helicase AddA [Gluconacetobacter liquefaciens]MBB2188158.1 double-strand break repair helicase AddA [Gluconacetobacter liquefaciens]RDI36059.1 DNA helicase/exodeoxyribonuclease V subunit A [Gluconacetobacter liquefaciens]GEB38469.1 double-strand break repair helicase AddA [Gluconacetobacter liquefaciens]
MNVTSRDAIGLANARQAEASDPEASVFVSASAGSGKTKLLIDRLLRLMLPRVGPEGVMLPGSDPSRIQCLTFTKAAAAEMAIRLQNRLGRWVTLPDGELDRELAALSVPPGEAARRAARELFARVLDLPGGMRIGTIHAFCQSLLRRFPVEAAISPHFTLVEDADARMALGEAVEAVVGAGGDSVALLAGQVMVGAFAALVGGLQAQMRRLRPVVERLAVDRAGVEAAMMRVLGVRSRDEESLRHAACVPPDEAHLRAVLRVVAEDGPAGARRTAVGMLDWLALPPDGRAARWDVWRAALVTKENEPRKRGGLSAKFDAEHEGVCDALVAEAGRVIAIDEECRAIALLRASMALLDVAVPVLLRYGDRKRGQGLVDYDDLIERTLDLLKDPGAAWVLYKLDGGIDHLLLDEVQDTSPDQWAIAGGLTAEFFAGAGAREPDAAPRTLFAVGDYKQSIYSFQGADPEAFRLWRARFRQRVEEAGSPWKEPALTVSFRSTAPVLNLVDAVFALPDAARGLVEPGGEVPVHLSARPGQGGRVELWPLMPVEDDGGEADPWRAPRENAGQSTAAQRLADALAAWIVAELRRPPEPGQAPLTPGDVLVLVPRRSAFVRALIRALKTHDVPVATLVRTGLVDQVAVQDLMALCDALLLPQDDLTLACVLTSPLGGVSDDSLMALAAGRGEQPLWAALRRRHAERPEWQAAWTMLETLFRQVDYASPYGLLSTALGTLGGRARLLARLGPEAAEPVDELLSAALRYESLHPASLQGFLHWLRASQETVKREPDAAADMVRVMTAHGAKGLQARLVILPDTVGAAKYDGGIVWGRDDVSGLEVPVWVPRAEMGVDVTGALQRTIREAAAEEYHRLLYVALTRASDRLVVCGWQQKRTVAEDCWYSLCRQGFEQAGAEERPFDLGWEGTRLVLEAPAAVPSTEKRAARAEAVPAALPDWMGSAPGWKATPPPVEAALMRPLVPSRPDDAPLGPQPAVRSPLAIAQARRPAAREQALRRGEIVHALLQYLPDHPPARRREVALAWLARPGNGLDPAEQARIAGQVLAVMDEPALAPLFGPGSRAEQPVAGVAGGSVIVGQVDRMVVCPDAVLLCDFKTNRLPPKDVESTSVLYLRQMASYRALMAALYPDRPVRCTLVWTEEVRIMPLPDSLLLRHAPDAVPDGP